MKRTPLYSKHVNLGGKMVDFNGWELPVQYSGIIDEHLQVRKSAGLFDVSHMGEILVEGPDAGLFIDRMVTNRILGAQDYRIIYSPMCYPDGGVVDDLLVYKYPGDKYFLVVNAGNADKDYNWLMENAQGQISIKNVSDQYAQLALQGPKAQDILKKLTRTLPDELRYFSFWPEETIGGGKAIISRTGYTGEDGFEIYVHAEYAPGIWDKLMLAGKDDGLVPVGLGARDTLRFEAALPLYGHELSPEITPLEAGLGRFVKLDKDDFIGKKALLEQKEDGLKRKRIGFEMLDRGIPRNGYQIQVGGKEAGFVTSGSYSPSLGKNIGIGLIDMEQAEGAVQLDILIRNKPCRAQEVKLPFYSRK